MTKMTNSMSAGGLTRRQIIEGGMALTAATGLTGLPVFAEDKYPSKDIHVIAPFPPGSGADIFVRYFAENTRPFLGGTIIVENKVGASGNLAVNQVARATPDGYTILIFSPSGIAGNMAMFKNPGYDAATAFEVLGSVARLPFTVSVSIKSPHKTMADLIAAVKAKGANASYGTTAPTGQVAGAMMKKFLNLSIVEVPYRTAADSVNDLDAGAVDYMMYDPIFAIPRHREGKIRVLAVSSKERMSTAPDIPTMHESGVPGVDVVGWWGLIVPAGVPEPIKEQLSEAFLKMARKPETKEWLAKFGTDSWVIGRAQSQKQMLQEIKNWAEFVKIANIEPKG